MTSAHRLRIEPARLRSLRDSLMTRGLGSVDTHPSWLPDEIDRSWRRSISSGASADPRSIRLLDDYDADSEFGLAARPVLDRLQTTLQDMRVAIFLSDNRGQIVARRVTDRVDAARLDRACAAEGFDFSEGSIGTNGLGTSMEEPSAVFVSGAEHYNEALSTLACAGMGIRHPTTGRVLGSLSLAAPLDSAELMMVAMVRQASQQIVDNLRDSLGRRDAALTRSYQQHRARGPVIVLNSDTVMTNVTGLTFLSPESHASLWEELLAQDWGRGPHVLDLDLRMLQARVLAHRIDDATGDPAFAVEILRRAGADAPTRPTRAARARTDLDRLVGQVDHAMTGRTGALAVTGPGGAGKLHLATAWLRAQGQQVPLVLDAADLDHLEGWAQEARERLSAGGAVVVRRLEDLSPVQLNRVKDVNVHLQSLGAQPATPRWLATPRPRLVLTADQSRCSEAVATVLAQVAEVVELPPLANRREYIPGLIEALLGDLPPGTRPVIGAAAMQTLTRWGWPGNVAELRSVLLGLAQARPGQPVEPAHLPDRMGTATRGRRLSRMESAERTEIVTALRQSGGNRSAAAQLLGIGRTTLYRKLRALGIDEEALSV